MPEAVRVGPGIEKPNFHVALYEPVEGERIGIVLLDGQGKPSAAALGMGISPRPALKISQGNTGYADFELPWTPITQDDWSGGMGLSRYERDTTRFLDSFRLNTTRANKVFPSTQERYTKGYRDQHFLLPGNVHWHKLLPGSMRYLSIPFTTTGAWSAVHIQLLIRRTYLDPTGALTVELRADSANNPGTVLKTVTLTPASFPDVVSQLYSFRFTAQALTGSTRYWVTVYGPAGDGTTNHWEVAVDKAPAAVITKESAAGSTWALSSVDLYYRITDADESYDPIGFVYKGASYKLTRNRSGTGAPELWLEGDRGTADANTGNLDKLNDATKSWAVDRFKNKTVMLVGGKGFEEETPWRKITANIASQLVVDPPWLVEHDTTTEYVILGDDEWQLITGHGLTAAPTHVFVHRGIVYVCQGDSVNIRRMRFYTTGGNWTAEYADDGTNKAVHMAYVEHSAGAKVWKTNNKDGSGNVSVASADQQDWGTNLTFAAAVRCGDNDDRITGAHEVVDNGARVLFILKEAGNWTASGTSASRVPLDETRTVKAYTNGRAWGRWDVYLFFSLLGGVQRYLDGVLTNVGPDIGEGLPVDRQGVAAAFLSLPGILLAAYDAGPNGYSSIMAYNGAGWGEWYRAPEKGQRIRSLWFQVCPGLNSRIWFGQGSDVLYLPWPGGGFDPLQDVTVPYTHESHLITSYMSAGLYDLWKLYSSLKVVSRNLSEGGAEIAVDYRLDEGTAWTPMEELFDVSPTEELAFREDLTLKGKRIGLRLRLLLSTAILPPVVETTLMEVASQVPVTRTFSAPFRLQPGNPDLNGAKTSRLATAEEMNEKLLDYAENLVPLIFEAISPIWHGYVCFLNPAPLRAAFKSTGKRDEFIGELSVMVIRALPKKVIAQLAGE